MMTLHTKQFTVGSAVRCADGACGRLRRVVIEPIERIVTHLVVKPAHGRVSRLIPLGLVVSVDRGLHDEVLLRCSLTEFETYERAQESFFLAGASGRWGYRQEQMLSWPHYRISPDAAPARNADASNAGEGTAETVRSRKSIRGPAPLGSVRVRRGDHIQATDGRLGRVQGLAVDRVEHRITHVLLGEEDTRGRTRAAIPIGSIIDIDEVTHGVRVDLTRVQVSNLPAVELGTQG
jgi:hypothetical protein